MRIHGYLAALALVFSGCVGTETGNPPLAASGGVLGTGVMGILPPLTLSDARLAIEAMTFLPVGACPDGEGDEAIGAPVSADLLGTSAEPFDLALYERAYCGLRIRLAPSPALADLALVLDGERAGDHAPVSVADAEPLAVILEATNGSFTIEEGETVLFTVDRNLLVASLEVATLELDPDGTAYVDATRNPDRLAALRARLPEALALARDPNGDGALDSEEAALDPIAQGN